MIQDIASSSGGAVIKILADKKEIKYAEEETVVAVIGSQSVILDAICKIIEQIEYFKHGGPVLSSGKAIFQSIPQQFRSSIILKNLNSFNGKKIVVSEKLQLRGESK